MDIGGPDYTILPCKPGCLSPTSPHPGLCWGFDVDLSEPRFPVVKKECTGCGNEWTAPVLDCPGCGPAGQPLLTAELVSAPAVSITINGTADEVFEILKSLGGKS